MEQLDLPDFPLSDSPALWKRNPAAAFETWQRSMLHADGYLYSERSIRQHRAMWHRFMMYLEATGSDLFSISADRLAQFLDSLRSKDGAKAEDSTRRRYLKLLSTTFDHLLRIGLRRSGNPCASLFRHYRPAPERMPVALASKHDEVFVEMVLASTPQTWREQRDQAMLLLIFGSGLYTSEVIGLTLEQVVLDAMPPYIHIPAHGKVPERKAPIIEFAREPLARWLQMRELLVPESEQTVFISGKGGQMLPATLYRKVQAFLKANDAALRSHGGFGPQVLRNSFLMRQLAKDKPVDVVQQWAGHVETKSTLRFRGLVVNPRGIEAE